MSREKERRDFDKCIDEAVKFAEKTLNRAVNFMEIRVGKEEENWVVRDYQARRDVYWELTLDDKKIGRITRWEDDDGEYAGVNQPWNSYVFYNFEPNL